MIHYKITFEKEKRVISKPSSVLAKVSIELKHVVAEISTPY